MAFLKKFRWDVRVPEIQQYIGRSCRVKDDHGRQIVVECEEILGSLAYPTKFQITSKERWFLISMLDFFAQMNGEKVSEEDIKAFDDTAFHVQARPGWKPFGKGNGKLWIPH